MAQFLTYSEKAVRNVPQAFSFLSNSFVDDNGQLTTFALIAVLPMLPVLTIYLKSKTLERYNFISGSTSKTIVLVNITK